MTTGHVPARRRVLGLDLGGARMRTTGFAVLEGTESPRVVSSGLLDKAKSAELAERELLEFIEDARPDVVAVDAPLTLPPCLSCPGFCRGPSSDLCELQAARAVWEAGGHPVTERLCEVLLRPDLESGPLPSMRIGQIAARGVALARRLLAGGTKLGPPGSVQVLEVYPYATLARLGASDPRLRPRDAAESEDDFAQRVSTGLSTTITGLDGAALDSAHAVDALVAAYTGWLSPDGLEGPPSGFNVASGWIWLPEPTQAA